MKPVEAERWQETHYLGEIQMARISKRMLGIVAAATVIGGTALGVAVTGGTAHAQATSSISFTSATLAGTAGSGYYPVVTFSVTCPAGDDLALYATVIQGQTTAGESFPNLISCTGNPQAVNVTADSGEGLDMAAGQAFLGATLRVGTLGLTPQASLAQVIAIG
jgi:hypothetical protein